MNMIRSLALLWIPEHQGIKGKQNLQVPFNWYVIKLDPFHKDKYRKSIFEQNWKLSL